MESNFPESQQKIDYVTEVNQQRAPMANVNTRTNNPKDVLLNFQSQQRTLDSLKNIVTSKSELSSNGERALPYEDFAFIGKNDNSGFHFNPKPYNVDLYQCGNDVSYNEALPYGSLTKFPYGNEDVTDDSMFLLGTKSLQDTRTLESSDFLHRPLSDNNLRPPSFLGSEFVYEEDSSSLFSKPRPMTSTLVAPAYRDSHNNTSIQVRSLCMRKCFQYV